MAIIIKQFKSPRIRPYAFEIKSNADFMSDNMNNELIEVLEWVILEIGTIKSSLWELRWPRRHSNFINLYIEHEEDAIAFKLRWV